MSNELLSPVVATPVTLKPDWAAIHADPDFAELHRLKARFLWRLMAISVLFYFLLPIGAGYFPEIFKIKLWGPLNVGLVFALSQFGVAWGIAFVYARRANGEFDQRAAALVARYSSSKTNSNLPGASA